MNTQVVEGTLIVQLVGPRLLKAGAFPVRSSSAAGFDANATLYER